MLQYENLNFCNIDFDTQYFGFPCAIYDIGINNSCNSATLKVLKQQAKNEGIKFLTITSISPLIELEKHFQGMLCEYTGNFSEVFNRVSAFPNRFRIEKMEESNFHHVIELAKYRSPNRFSTDTHFNSDNVFWHKISLYKTQFEKFPQLAFIAYTSNNQPIGYHFCTQDKNNITLYDLVVHPQYRIGIVAVDLIGACLKTAIQQNFKTTILTTKIYSDNKLSIEFFTKLGLKKNDKQKYYYHFWL